MGRHGVLGAVLLGLLVAPRFAMAQQQSSCADCHFANPTAPARNHLEAWDRSPHGRRKVGCETCHGGDATTFEATLAHRGILSSADPESPVNRRNLPRTCGRCHAGPFAAYQKSEHFSLLETGDTRVPVCATCHGTVAAERPSPRALEGECRDCHGPKGVARREERAEAARTLYESVHESRDLLDATRLLIAHVRDKRRRAQLETLFQQAEAPLKQSIAAGHEFVYDDLKERLATARQRIEALLGQLANPK
jgi:hypothetical protein